MSSIRFEGVDAIYLHRDHVDFRKSIDGLALVVENQMNLDPFSDSIFLFTNQRRTRMKILYWDQKTGFALWMKRLEKEKFPWPRRSTQEVLTLTEEQLTWLLQGYEFFKLKPHEKLEYTCLS